MSEKIITLIVLLSPLGFVLTALASRFQDGRRPKMVIAVGSISSILTIIIAVFSCLSVYNNSLIQSGFLGLDKLGFSIRLDSVSSIMFLMIALLSFIIIKFSVNYLEGDQKHGAFIGRLAATIASVELLVLSGNLGLLLVSWIFTSISLHRLLIFYKDRPTARVAAKKKFILARLGDLCLFLAVILLYNQFRSGNLETIFASIRNTAGNLPFWGLEAPALLLGFAAILKSAQFPTHGWLIEVMETPTPVSALLHAGLLNAGPFLIVRMAYVINASTVTPLLLMSIGGLTALFASIIFLTQTSVKTALGYSSVAHMGFSLMLCGLGVYSAAMLHLVAHSFYKAHSFLSSGSGIDVLKASRIKKETEKHSPAKIILGILMALALYAVFAITWGIDLDREFSLLIIGAVIVMGLSRIFTSAIVKKWNSGFMLRTLFIGLVVITAFFLLESGTHHILYSSIPELVRPGKGKIIVAGILLLLFGVTVLIQMIAPQLSSKPSYQKLAIHIRNGFYANALFDRLIGSLRIHSSKNEEMLRSLESSKYETKEAATKELQEQIA
ncbi:NADH/ubiquinone/plastoquinone (complex i) [Christiangramia fulva]|uniref:Probable inorganic carbon transporter subunit DabB n=1 Tax=Christiangramia fulva TaxID=2126553 RepID=A0A2R3Z4B6_9FLAO|nr:proton-conducting transporter membrane subunit [Christiangramia fulva]AVR45123.1 NADH/ubiquinone/plastoquinone (complex i) [Christiangramia fulva]